MIFRLDFHLPVWLMCITLLMCCSSVFPQLRFTYPTCNCTSKCYLVLACHLQRFGKVVLFEHFPGVFRGRDVCIEYQLCIVTSFSGCLVWTASSKYLIFCVCFFSFLLWPWNFQVQLTCLPNTTLVFSSFFISMQYVFLYITW